MAACALLLTGVLGAFQSFETRRASAASVPKDSDRVSRSLSEREQRGGLVVVQVKGLLDVPNVSLLRETLEQVNRDHRTLLLIQLDSRGAIADVDALVRALERSRVPVVAWIGPPGAEARGGAALVASAAHRVFVAPGATLGATRPERLDDPDERTRSPRNVEPDGRRPTIGETIVKLDGKTVTTSAGEVELSTARVVGEGRDRRRQPNQEVVFETLDAAGQVQHLLISPSIVYAFLVLGLALIVFEFFAASVGFAAFVGALMVVGGLYGSSHLPVRWWAVALLLLSAFGFAVDAQAGDLGFWTGVGVLTLVAGSFTLVGGTDLSPPWWAIAIVSVLVVLFYLFAIPSFIRARFSSPTVGREGMVGELGTAEVAVAPEGVVLVRGARWRARTNRATPIAAGDAVRVVSVEGLVLEVEPETGGARDYRDRARRRRAQAPNKA